MRRRHRLFPIDAVEGVANTHNTGSDNGNSNGYNNDEDDDDASDICFCDDCMSVIFIAAQVDVAGNPRMVGIVFSYVFLFHFQSFTE